MKTADIIVGNDYYIGNTLMFYAEVIAVRQLWTDLGRKRTDGVRLRANYDVVLDGGPERESKLLRRKGDEWFVKPRDIFRARQERVEGTG